MLKTNSDSISLQKCSNYFNILGQEKLARRAFLNISFDFTVILKWYANLRWVLYLVTVREFYFSMQ